MDTVATKPSIGGSRRWWALAALAASSLIMSIDSSVLNLALPTLSSALHASTAELQWFVDAYTLVMAALMLPAGLLGDRLGRQRVMAVALALFAGASIACAYAPSAGAFIAARAAAGVGAAFFLPMSLAVLTVLFTPQERPKAIAILVGMSMAAAPIGPIVGGYLLAHAWWGSVFLINVPVVAVALVLVVTLLPDSKGPRRPLDLVGVLSSSAALAALVYGIIEAGENGWGDPGTLVALAIGFVLLAGFVAWELRLLRAGGEPLVDLRLFRSAGFSSGVLLMTLMSFSLFGISFIGPQFFQAIKGVDPQGTGLRLLPTAVGLLIGTVVGNRMLARVGAKATVALGFTVLAAALSLGSFTRVTSGDEFVLAWVGTIGFGAGLVMPASNNSALAALPRAQAGVGSSVIMAVRTVGGAFGVAIMGSVLNAIYRSNLDLAGLPAAAAATVQKSVFGGIGVAQAVHSVPLLTSVQQAFATGMDAMLVVSAAIALAGALLALAFLPTRDEQLPTKAEVLAETDAPRPPLPAAVEN